MILIQLKLPVLDFWSVLPAAPGPPSPRNIRNSSHEYFDAYFSYLGTNICWTWDVVDTCTTNCFPSPWCFTLETNSPSFHLRIWYRNRSISNNYVLISLLQVSFASSWSLAESIEALTVPSAFHLRAQLPTIPREKKLPASLEHMEAMCCKRWHWVILN